MLTVSKKDCSVKILLARAELHLLLEMDFVVQVCVDIIISTKLMCLLHQFQIPVLASHVMSMLFVRGKDCSLMTSTVLANLHLLKEMDLIVQV